MLQKSPGILYRCQGTGSTVCTLADLSQDRYVDLVQHQEGLHLVAEGTENNVDVGRAKAVEQSVRDVLHMVAVGGDNVSGPIALQMSQALCLCLQKHLYTKQFFTISTYAMRFHPSNVYLKSETTCDGK